MIIVSDALLHLLVTFVIIQITQITNRCCKRDIPSLHSHRNNKKTVRLKTYVFQWNKVPIRMMLV